MEIVVHRRLAAIVLLVALFGANTAMASVCEAYCAGVGKQKSDHHHQTAAKSSPSHHHMHAQQHRADCRECPKAAGQFSLQPPDCGRFTQVHALGETSRVFSNNLAVPQLNIVSSSVDSSLAAPVESERLSYLHSPPNISNFPPVVVSLRI